MLSRALFRGGPARFFGIAATVVAFAAAVPAADAADHNARVAEYLLLQHGDAGDRNAVVDEYLLLQHRNSGQ
jgi:hypothetical protein